MARMDQERQAIAKVWARGALARGDRLVAEAGRVKRRRCKEHRATWQHSRAWTLQGTLGVAFSSIGAMMHKAPGRRKTRRELDAIAA
eukprot:11027725-Lingulodinium_polyedra.AAC.1